jgi:hypothetical protein
MVDIESIPTGLGERFSLDGVINGLISDLEDLRGGRISVSDAKARAELAKQAMNGIRLVVTAQKFLEQGARQISALSLTKEGGDHE